MYLLWGVDFADIKGSGTDSFLVRPGRKMFLVVFAERRMVMDIYFGNVLFTPFNMCANFLSLLFLCHSGHGAYSGMVGCLVLKVWFMMIPGLSLLVI